MINKVISKGRLRAKEVSTGIFKNKFGEYLVIIGDSTQKFSINEYKTHCKTLQAAKEWRDEQVS